MQKEFRVKGLDYYGWIHAPRAFPVAFRLRIA